MTGAAPDKVVRWGVIGTGRIAATFTTDLHETGSGIMVAVGSRSQASAERFGEQLGVPHRHGSYEALAADPDVDVVYVATPHPMHLHNALLALEHGKPVLVEKAFAMDGGEARQIVAAARRAGLFAMEAMWTRFLPHVVDLRLRLSDGAIGDIVTVQADHGQWFGHDASSRLFAPELGGGALLDLGVYPVSWASMLLGPPERVVAISDPAFTGVDAQTSMVFGYRGGAHAVLTCTLSAVSPTRATIVGTDGRIEVDGPFYAPSSWTLVPRSGTPIHFACPESGRGLWHEADEVARCLGSGLVESPQMPLDETVSIMDTLDIVMEQSSSVPLAPPGAPVRPW